jgi:glycosyltransferase involved in cell wall biosynthesis
MLEAMACGTPVVAYERGAAAEVVVHGKTGFIARNFSELLAGIGAVADIDPDNCRQHVARNFMTHGRSVAVYISHIAGTFNRHIVKIITINMMQL